jgi:hypothetical protein
MAAENSDGLTEDPKRRFVRGQQGDRFLMRISLAIRRILSIV